MCLNIKIQTTNPTKTDTASSESDRVCVYCYEVIDGTNPDDLKDLHINCFEQIVA